MAASMAWCSAAPDQSVLQKGLFLLLFQTRKDVEKLQESTAQGQCAGLVNKKHFPRRYKSAADESAPSNPASAQD